MSCYVDQNKLSVLSSTWNSGQCEGKTFSPPLAPLETRTLDKTVVFRIPVWGQRNLYHSPFWGQVRALITNSSGHLDSSWIQLCWWKQYFWCAKFGNYRYFKEKILEGWNRDWVNTLLGWHAQNPGFSPFHCVKCVWQHKSVHLTLRG